MVDVRGDVLRPPHGTTPAAVKSKELHIAGGTVVILGLFEMQDVIDLQVKPEPHGLVQALVGHELLCDGFAELLLGR